MQAAVLTADGTVEVQSRDRPDPGPGDVVVQVGACGVCMTDYHIFHGAFDADPPVVLGHESAGTVVAAGADVTGVAAGDRVAVNPLIPCGTCEFCRQGRESLCRNASVVGGAGDDILDGSFAEYVRVPARSVEPVGDLAVERAALAEPLGCCIHGADRAPITSGDTVAIVGAGPIGLLLLQVYRNRGAGEIVVSELDEDRRELASELGADHVVNPDEVDPVAAVEDLVGGADVAAEVVGSVPTIEQARRMTKRGGATLVFGVPPQDATWEIDPFEVYYREMDVLGTYSLTADAFRRAITLLRTGRIDADAVTTERLGLDGLPTAFDRMERSEGLKKLVVPGTEP
ncbi:MAG: zinc-dependent alcohol dehydrogenase family protein [Halobacteriaceae archaeon]